MSESRSGKNNSVAIAVIGLIGTIVTAVFGSPVLVEWIRSRQVTATPSAVVTQLTPQDVETPVISTALPDFSEQVLIFREDFDSDTVSGFAYQGNWQVSKDKNNRVLESGGNGKATFGPSDFTHGVIEFRVQMQDVSQGAFATVNFREGGGSAYALSVSENQLTLGFRAGDGAVQAFSDESVRALVFEPDVWYLIRVEVRGPQMLVFVDNNRIMSATDERLGKGGISFSVNEMQAVFDDVSVWELK